MTEDRDFKRLVRQRQAKTGESYTAARAHLRPGGSKPSVWQQWDEELRAAAGDPLEVMRLAGPYLAYLNSVLSHAVDTALQMRFDVDEITAALGPRYPEIAEPPIGTDVKGEPLRDRWDHLVTSKAPDLIELIRVGGTFRRYLEAVRRRATRETRSAGISIDEVVKAQSIWPKPSSASPAAKRAKLAWATTSTDELVNDLLKAGGPLRLEGQDLRRTRRFGGEAWPE